MINSKYIFQCFKCPSVCGRHIDLRPHGQEAVIKGVTFEKEPEVVYDPKFVEMSFKKFADMCNAS